MDIYDADGFLDRGKILGELDSVPALRGNDRDRVRRNLVNLLDECSEGFTANPLDAPTMTAEYINTCRPAWSAAPPLDVTTGKPVPR